MKKIIQSFSSIAVPAKLSSIGIWYIIEALVDRQLEIAVNEVSIDSLQGP